MSNYSSYVSSSILILADAKKAYPRIIKNITSSNVRPVTFSDKTYKFQNCCAAFSPLDDVALIITRSGTVKLANFREGFNGWTIGELSVELDSSEEQWWRFCSLGFSKDGYRAFALDLKGTLLIIDFVPAK